MASSDSDGSGSSPRLGLSELSAETLAALQSVLLERASATDAAAADPFSAEDWGKSQFIYDRATAATLAAEVAALGGTVACVSCPTLFRTLKDDHPGVACHLLEFDEKYGCRGDFTRFDYNAPLDVPAALHHAFDVVVADPPYLAEECLVKTAETVRLLARSPSSRLLLLTGAVMRRVAAAALGVRPCVFRPQHNSKLGNDFYCYTSYDPPREGRLGGWDAQLLREDAEAGEEAAG